MNAAQPLTFTDCSKICYCIFPHDIIYVEADNIYSLIIQIDHFIRVPYPLHLIQDLLPDYFLRIHRSFLVNQNSITALYPRTILLSNGLRLPVPERKYKWLKSYLETVIPGLSTEYPPPYS